MKIAFVNMPFSSKYRPSLGVSLLKSKMTQQKIQSQIFYFNLHFAKLIGNSIYDLINDDSPPHSLLGELIFAHLLYGENNQREQYIAKIAKSLEIQNSIQSKEYFLQKIDSIRNILQTYIDNCADEIVSYDPDFVGFTTTFHQTIPSILLAKKLKNIEPSIVILFGGANCEGEMGHTLISKFPVIDYVFSGESDKSLPNFLHSFSKKENISINGVITYNSTELDVNLTDPVLDMDVLPYPDFEDYFTTLKKLNMSDVKSHLVLETSRGCWWGERSHCTFCGLNGNTMQYRSKTPKRALDEIKFLLSKYQNKSFFVVDNILDMKYINTLLLKIIDAKLGISLLYETKSNLSKKQLGILKQSGIHSIQPGIESLSDTILSIMKKGVTGLQNIALLKWCRELDIKPIWNLLGGFPGEPKNEYYKMSKIIPLLTHLQPPSVFSPIRLDRFSPYYNNPHENGITNVRPSNAYTLAFPFSKNELSKLAYYFDFDYLDHRDPMSYSKKIFEQVTSWNDIWKTKPPVLDMVKENNLLMINDTRSIALQKNYLFEDVMAEIYAYCDIPQSIYSIYSRFEKNSDLSHEKIHEILNFFVENKLMIVNGKYLSLSVDVSNFSQHNN